MAKHLAAGVEWSNADNLLRIHGGNGYAMGYPVSRVLYNARIPNIFEAPPRSRPRSSAAATAGIKRPYALRP